MVRARVRVGDRDGVGVRVTWARVRVGDRVRVRVRVTWASARVGDRVGVRDRVRARVRGQGHTEKQLPQGPVSSLEEIVEVYFPTCHPPAHVVTSVG